MLITPVEAIIWCCVFVFAATSLIMLSSLSFGYPKIPAKFRTQLFNYLLIEVVSIGVVAFGNHVYNQTTAAQAKETHQEIAAQECATPQI